MQDLRITLIQSPLHWEEPEANMAMFEEKMWELKEPTDLILLPEMFNTGFTMITKGNWEHKNGRTVNWMKQQAAQFKAVVAGSLIIKDDNHFYNRLAWVTPEGEVDFYDKRHLFSMTDEDKGFTGGKERKIFKVKGWKVMPMICYDLRFPVWSRNRADSGIMDYDLLVFVANWPKPRVNAWRSLLKARAIENLSYVAGLNRIGEDGNGFEYNGFSAVVDYKGEIMQEFGDEEAIMNLTLNYEALTSFREKFPAWNDSDEFSIEV